MDTKALRLWGLSATRWLAGAATAVVALMPTPMARALPVDVPLAQLSIRTWDRRDGLSTNMIDAVVETPDGLVWFGTQTGLYALDGVAVRRFTTSTTPELPADAIEALAVDGDVLWIGTPRGLGRYEAGVFRRVGPDAGIGAVRVFSLVVPRPGELWAGTTEGQLIGRNGRFAPLTERPGGPPVRHVCPAVASSGDGDMLLACDGLYAYRGGILGPALAVPPGAHEVAVGPHGEVWVGFTHAGVLRIDGGRSRPVVARPDGVTALYVDREGALWVGGAGPKMQRIAPDGRIDEVTLPDGRVVAGVKAFWEEPDGAMLIASGDTGLVRLSAGMFRVLDRRSGGPPETAAVFEDRGGTVWLSDPNAPELVGVGAAGIVRYPLSLPALSHLETAAGTHYVGTPTGLMKIVGDHLEAVPLGHDAVIFSLVEAPDGAIWAAATADGLMRIAPDGAVTEVKRPDGGNVRSMTIALSRDRQRLWVGTERDLCSIDGVAHGVGAPLVCLGESAGVPSAASTVSLYEDAAGSLWVGTYEHGLFRVKNGHAAVLMRAQGLPFDTAYEVFEDAEARLWFSGPLGIARAPRTALDAVADGRAATASVRLFDTADGLPVDEAYGAGMMGYQTGDGRLWFSTPGGAVEVDPRVPDPPVAPLTTVIEELRVGDRELPLAGGAVPDEDRTLLVRYTAPTLTHPREVRFRYRLDGVDGAWVDAGDRRIAMYTSLPPGRHVFHVAALAAHGAGFGPEATFAIDVDAAFSETLAFRLLLLAAGLAVLYLGLRLRVAQHVAREAHLGQLVTARTSDLAAAKGELETLNASLAERVTDAVAKLRASERMAAYGHAVAGVAHEVRQPLFALSTTAFVLKDKLRDLPELRGNVALLDRETQRMNRVMDELLDFAKPTALLLGCCEVQALLDDAVEVFRAEHDPERVVPITVDGEPGIGAVRVDRDRLQQVVVNLLSNAKKHAVGMTGVVLRARDDAASVVIEVVDDGPAGIPAGMMSQIFDPFFTTGGTGLGLAIARRIVEEHGGTLTVSSEPGRTTFRIALPRGREADVG